MFASHINADSCVFVHVYVHTYVRRSMSMYMFMQCININLLCCCIYICVYSKIALIRHDLFLNNVVDQVNIHLYLCIAYIGPGEL